METTPARSSCAVAYIRARFPDPYTERQERECQRIAEEFGLTILRTYHDYGVPTRLPRQVELPRLLSDLEQQRDAAYVIVASYASLSRDFEQIEARLAQCDAEIATITGIDAVVRTSSGSGTGGRL